MQCARCRVKCPQGAGNSDNEMVRITVRSIRIAGSGVRCEVPGLCAQLTGDSDNRIALIVGYRARMADTSRQHIVNRKHK